MAFYFLQAGSTLQRMTAAGALTSLTLPTGVTIDSTKRGRFAVLGRKVVLVNSPTINLVIDADALVTPMCIPPPASPPIITASGTGLTGAYYIRESFVKLDSAGFIIAESPMGPATTVFTAANQGLGVSGCAINPYSFVTITARREYRTTAGGADFYELQDVDGNSVSSYVDSLADASLALVPISPFDDLGVPAGTLPGSSLKLIVSWRNRLWAVADTDADRDYLIYCEELKSWAWPAANSLPINPIGADIYGVTGLIPRRDELNICKRNKILKLTGYTNDDFQVYGVVEGVGCVAPDSIAVIRDQGYFLAEDGVYRIGPDGVVSLSREKVHPWFSTDTYFNRSRFPDAFAHYNRKYDTYELHLAAAGSSVENRWVSYDIKRGEWLGPHKTASFTPTFAALVRDANDLDVSVIGSSGGYIYTKNNSTFQDDPGNKESEQPIDFDIISKAHSGDAPDIDHMWLELAILTKIETGGTLSIIPYLGRLDAVAGTTLGHDLTLGRQRLARLGRGALCKLRFSENSADQGCTLFGYEMPFFEVGRR